MTSIARNPVDLATTDKRDDTSETEHYVTSIARNPVDVATADERDDTYETEHHVAFIARNAVPTAMTLPNQPCEEMSVDFAHVDGEILLLVIDDYSRFPFVEPVSSEAASAVIPKLDKIFATFGTPNVVKSDNGPPFNGEDFAKFADVLGFKHRKVTPLWPRTNGEVERFVKTMKKCVKAAKSEGKNWRKEMQAFLRNYRTTPHSTTGVAPSTLFLKRAVRNKLPQSTSADPVAEIVRKRDVEQKWKMKYHADRKRYVKPCDLEVGEPVLVKRPFTASKAHAPYESRPMTIVARKGSMITAITNQGQNVTRNSSFFKRLRVPNGSLCSESSEQRIRVPNGSLCSESSEQRIRVPSGSLCSESSELRDDFEPSDDIATKDKHLQIEPVVHPEPGPQLNVDPELPIIRRSTRVRKAPDVLDL